MFSPDRSQLKIEVPQQLNFTIDAPDTFLDYITSVLINQGECSHFCCCDLNFEAIRLNHRLCLRLCMFHDFELLRYVQFSSSLCVNLQDRMTALISHWDE